MKNYSVRNNALALVGLAALTIYILACTSFSPDDKKILYPSLEPQSGAPGVAIYDRETSRSRTVFVPAYCENPGTNQDHSPTYPVVRPQWLGDGRRILCTWVDRVLSADHLQLAVIPVAGEGALRWFDVETKGFDKHATIPIPVVGEHAFISGDERVLKLNLTSGEVKAHELTLTNAEFYIYPGFAEENLFYLLHDREKEDYVFGRLNPETLARTPCVSFTNEVGNRSFFAYDAKGRIAFVKDKDDGQELAVLEPGKPEWTRPISATEKLAYGSGIFLPRKNVLLASYLRSGTNTASVGLLEIPLDKGGAIRDTILIAMPSEGAVNDENAGFLQVGVSHDGKTAAVSTLYALGEEHDPKPEHFGLFLVDLNNAKRKVTRVPIPMPGKDPKVHPFH